MRKRFFSQWRPAKVQTSLHIRAILPEPLLFPCSRDLEETSGTNMHVCSPNRGLHLKNHKPENHKVSFFPFFMVSCWWRLCWYSQLSLYQSPRDSRSPRDSLKHFWDIHTSTYQICRIEEKINRTTALHKWTCNLTPEVRDILKILWKRGEISSFSQYFIVICFPCLNRDQIFTSRWAVIRDKQIRDNKSRLFYFKSRKTHKKAMVDRTSNCRSRACKFEAWLSHLTLMEIAHEIIYSRSHPLHWFKKAIVSYLQKYEHKVLIS